MGYPISSAKVCTYDDESKKKYTCIEKEFDLKGVECKSDNECGGYKECAADLVNKDDTKKCRGTSKYHSISSQGYIKYINEERLKMLTKEDEESKVIRRRMDKKVE